MGPPIVLAIECRLKKLFIGKLFFFLNLKPFTPMSYMHTVHSVCKQRGSQVKVYNPSIPTVAIFFKSNKNWLSYDLLKNFQADFFHPGQKVTKLWPLNRLVSIFMQSLIGLPILVLIYIYNDCSKRKQY